ncbi:sodium-dependent transporter [bacterium]|nr:sodium-dependent transporter [bacterium]
MSEKKEHWGSSFGFIMAMAGSAVGLGNIWRFSFITGQNGGSAFLLVYLGCVFLVGIPIMLCELTMGRAAQSNPVRTFHILGPSKSRLSNFLGFVLLLCALASLSFSHFFFAALFAIVGASFLRFGWVTLGVLYGAVTPLFILAYYGVVGGWTLIYVCKSFLGQLNVQTVEEASAIMTPIIMAPKGSWTIPLLATLFFMLTTSVIIWIGVQKGIERFSKIFMPMLALLLIVLIFRGLSLPNATKGLKFLFVPDFSQLSGRSVLAALGHAFYSLSLGMGITITYGAYLKPDNNLPRSTVTVALLDTLVSVMAGLAIFPVVFAMGFAPDSGPSLIFKVLPLAFQKLPLSTVWNVIFFLAVLIAALTSAVSLLEGPVCLMVEELKWKRSRVLFILVPCLCAVSCVITLSCGDYANFPSLGTFIQKTFMSTQGSLFDAFDYASCQWLIPIACFLTLLYAGWVWGPRNAVKEMRSGSTGAMDTGFWHLLTGVYEHNTIGDPSPLAPCVIWAFFIRFISPILVLLAFLDGLGVFR